MDPARFVFIDETGTATNMARRYGRSPCVERLVTAVMHGPWRTMTFIAGLRQAGIIAQLETSIYRSFSTGFRPQVEDGRRARRPPALGPVSTRHRALELWPEHFEVDHRGQPFEVVAFL